MCVCVCVCFDETNVSNLVTVPLIHQMMAGTVQYFADGKKS
jgi:hypothetical protein